MQKKFRMLKSVMNILRCTTHAKQSTIAIHATALDIDTGVSIRHAWLNQPLPRHDQRLFDIVFESSTGLAAIHHPGQAICRPTAWDIRLALVCAWEATQAALVMRDVGSWIITALN